MKAVRMIIVAVAAILSASVSSWAARQNPTSYKGNVYDKGTGEAMEFVTVALRQADSSIVAAAMTSADGTFDLKAPAGTYIIEASFMGYKSFFGEARVPGGIDIALEQDNELIAGAKVTDKVRLVEMKMDKIVLNVSQSAFAQGSNGLELLRKSPGVTIDKEGNVKLNGKSVSVWIDGRPSYMNGESLLALLRGTSGQTIDKIEIMEHPSSKYDAEGQGGIINIKTKKNVASGFNGSLGTDGGGMYFGSKDFYGAQAGTWANLNYRSAKTNTFLNLYNGYYKTGIDLTVNTCQTLPAGNQELISSSFQDMVYDAYNIKFGNDWFLNKKNTLGFIVTVPGNIQKMVSDPERNTSSMSLAGVPIETTTSSTSNKGRSNQLTSNLNYTHVFDETRNAELTANLDWYRSGGPTTNRQNTIVTYNDGRQNDIFKLITSDNLVNIYSAKADYQTVLWQKAMFETGVKWATSMTENDTDREESGLGICNTKFTYTEHIAAVYASIAAQFGPKFSVKAGLRGEYTDSFGDWITVSETTSRQYFDLFPTLFVGYSPADKLRLNLIYSRRISRPNYFLLNPVESLFDAHTSTVGNPDLLPEYNNDLAFQTGIGNHIMFSVGYSYADKVSMQFPSFKENGDRVLTWGNFGSRQIAFASASLSAFPLAKWLDWTLNTTGLYIDSKSSTDDFNNSGWSFNAYTGLTFNLPKDWKLECDFRYNSSTRWGFYKIDPSWGSDAGIKKTMLDNRLSLTLSVDDILRSQSSNMDILGDPSARNRIEQKYYAQKVRIGVNWTFGQAHQTRMRKVGQLDEASRVGTSSSVGK